MNTCASFLLALLAAVPAWAGSFEVITHGDRVNLKDHTAPGQLTLFDFYADWCGPCRQLEPHLAAIANENHGKLVLKKVDIVRWNTPVASQYGINSIPHLKLYGRDGKLVREGSARSVLAAVQAELGGGSLPTATHTGSGGFGILAKLGILFALIFVIGIISIFFASQKEKTVAKQNVAEMENRRQKYARDPKLQEIWFLQSPTGDQGPYSIEDLRSMLLSGHIRRESRVLRRSDPGPVTVSELMQST